MRPIKFRAWNKEKGEMDMHAHNRAYFGSRAENPQAFDDIFLMQYTGLKDKNGKEIYEGDVLETISVSIRDITDPYPHRRIVAWHEGDGRLDFHWIDGQPQTSGQTFCKNNLTKNWEIIGNIYENKELLS